MKPQPRPISAVDRQRRLRRLRTIARDLGFVGAVEYLHVYSRSGGAQYCIGSSADNDIILVYAEAFERDADPDDFSLEALIAHECGHQRLVRDPHLRVILEKLSGRQWEEILASLVGSVLLRDSETTSMLVLKAVAELSDLGLPDKSTVRLAERLRRLLEQLL